VDEGYRLGVAKILAWADLHHRKTGDWPEPKSGIIYGSRGEKWSAINTALKDGLRGLPPGSSLTILLASRRGIKRHYRGRQIRVSTILEWAKSHYRKTGVFPAPDPGRLADKLAKHGVPFTWPS